MPFQKVIKIVMGFQLRHLLLLFFKFASYHATIKIYLTKKGYLTFSNVKHSKF